MKVAQALPNSVNAAAYILWQAQSNVTQTVGSDLGHGPIAL